MPQSPDHKSRKISVAVSADNLRDTNIFTWQAYILVGSLLFMTFYWLVPAWLNHELSTLHHGTVRPIAETLFMRRIHWIQLAGIALGAICIVFAIHNYFSTRLIRRSISRCAGSNTNFICRLFVKLMG
jgi:hypothetical protein